MKDLQYRMYCVNSKYEIDEHCNKIYDDIKVMKGITEYDEILNFIEVNYGNPKDLIVKDFNDNIKLIICKEEQVIEVCVVDGGEMIMGRRWEFIPNKSKEDV